MNDIVNFDGVAEDEFFAPSTADFVDGMVAQHRLLKGKIDQFAAMANGENGDVLKYFIEANADRSFSFGKGGLFEPEGAVKALDAAYWSKSIQLTDLMNYMPQNRRTEWHDLIRERKCPPFEEETVRATLQDLLGKRHQFFAERVDGIFKNLSGEHVTNSPAAFGKRFILAYMHTDYGSWYSINHQRVGYINDLRCVIAKFMGRDEPTFRASDALIKGLQSNWGEWVQVDGGAFKIRLYKKGTAHIEVHPDMAWKLNSILASIYPSAIPAEFRTKPKRKPKDVVLMQRPLPFKVVEVLAEMKPGKRAIKQEGNWREPFKYESVPNSLMFESYDKHISTETRGILQSIGGVQDEKLWLFDYNPMPIVNQIVASGVIPDDKSHQYYPTPENVAQYAVDAADIKTGDIVLEPSAGIGNIADLVPKDANMVCVEVSALRCGILESKGYVTHLADFIKWAATQRHESVNKIVMNPPFDRGQWKAHVEHAAPLLKRGGRLVAILPEGAEGKFYLDGFNCTYPKSFKNEFNNTSVTVTVLVADKS